MTDKNIFRYFDLSKKDKQQQQLKKLATNKDKPLKIGSDFGNTNVDSTYNDIYNE